MTELKEHINGCNDWKRMCQGDCVSSLMSSVEAAAGQARRIVKGSFRQDARNERHVQRAALGKAKEAKGRPAGPLWAAGLQASQLSELCLAAVACLSRHGHRCGDRWGQAVGFEPAHSNHSVVLNPSPCKGLHNKHTACWPLLCRQTSHTSANGTSTKDTSARPTSAQTHKCQIHKRQ